MLLCAKNAWRKPNGPDFSLRRHRSTFHRFLKMLACFDGLVVTCIFLMYALPVMCSTYKKVKHFFPYSEAPECQKSWWGQAYMAGIICLPPPQMNRVNLSNKNWWRLVPIALMFLRPCHFCMTLNASHANKFKGLATRFKPHEVDFSCVQI